MTATRTDPAHVPGPGGDTSIAREPLWHAWATGTDHPAVPPWTWAPEPPPDEHVAPPLPEAARGGRRTPLPLGTVDLLEQAAYPAGRVTGTGDPLGHALVAAFGACRREPDNPYNDHRPYASARCLFPVQAVVRDGGRVELLEAGRHTLVELAARPSTPGREVVLTGRYPAVPRDYKWFRGSLVALEIGTTLRALCVALELFGVPGRLRLPGVDALDRLAGLGLTPAHEWSLPLTVELGDRAGRPAGPAARPAARPSGPPGPADPVLAEVLAVDRAQSLRPGAGPAALGAAVPTASAREGLSWAEVLWRRHSGRMPRGLHGMSGRRRRVPGAALDTLARWVAVPPPGPLADVFDSVRVTGVLQDVDGSTDGVYDVRAGAATLLAQDPGAPARLEEAYGYGPTPGNGCDVRHASMTWFLSVRPREVAARYGPGGWTAAQHACGWAAHGLCLGAAAAGLFARPVRAFSEVAARHVLGLGPEEMIVLAVVVGVPRHVSGTVLDIRT